MSYNVNVMVVRNNFIYRTINMPRIRGICQIKTLVLAPDTAILVHLSNVNSNYCYRW